VSTVTETLKGYRHVPPTTTERATRFERAHDALELGRDYRAELHTNRGTMVVELYQDHTPRTVNNFVFLALQRYYDGVPFHRVLDDFMAQTGDATGTGRGGPGYQFPDEVVPDLRHDGKGVVSMANAGPGTNGSQFFITFTATPWLDGKHTVFGQVIDGLDVLDALTRIDPGRHSGARPDQIERVDVYVRD
jgi:cyclophilin family peptidyl-prolyl cis-trans isomerase